VALTACRSLSRQASGASSGGAWPDADGLPLADADALHPHPHDSSRPFSWSSSSVEETVLADVNRGRAGRGLPPAERLTVALMKEALRDRAMPDGKAWRPVGGET
jgi:hypothetical protein